MQIEHEHLTTRGPSDKFSGEVWIDVLADGGEPSHLRVWEVRFTPGSRTAWHSHAFGQTLYVTDGLGLVQSRGAEPVEVHPGDTVTAAPGEWHWHGAAPDHFMTHIAIWESPAEGAEAEWGSPVGQDEYLGKTAVAR